MSTKTIPVFLFQTRPWIDGRWQGGGESFAVTEPATGRMIAEVVRADAAAVERAIDGAAARGGVSLRWREDQRHRDGGLEGVREFLDTRVISLPRPMPPA